MDPMAKRIIDWYDRRPHIGGRWFENKIFNIFVRDHKTWLDGKVTEREVFYRHSSLCIVTVSVLSGTGQGTFTKLITDLEASGHPIMIENILDDRFRQFFVRRGYTPYFEHWMRKS